MRVKRLGCLSPIGRPPGVLPRLDHVLRQQVVNLGLGQVLLALVEDDLLHVEVLHGHLLLPVKTRKSFRMFLFLFSLNLNTTALSSQFKSI